MRLDANLDLTWAIDACPYSVPHFDIDTAGQIVVACPDVDTGFLRKLDGDGNELWSVEVERESTGLVFDSSDHL